MDTEKLAAGTTRHRTPLDSTKLRGRWKHVTTIASRIIGSSQTVTLMLTTTLTDNPTARYEVRIGGRPILKTGLLNEAVRKYNEAK